jgi:hypothetical protein
MGEQIKMVYDNIVKKVDKYYTNRFKEYRSGPLAVDWNSKEAQCIRFEQLSKVLSKNPDEIFSLCDFGCGLGDYQKYLRNDFPRMEYTGIDISAEIIDRAKQIGGDGRFVCDSTIHSRFDYIVTSGIFNVRQDATDDEWNEYMLSTLSMFAEHSNKGFAFNCLTKYSDADRMQDYLYYADPLFLFDYCKTHFSRNVALLHDYDIYDFTILVRRDNTWDGKK